MLKNIVSVVLQLRFHVILVSLLVSVYGLHTVYRMPIDVFPDLDRPYVSVLVDAHGYAPEEIERLIAFPIESAMNGAPGVMDVRSSSGVGLAVITIEFDWGLDIYLCRQIVQERLQLAQAQLPKNTVPILAPVSSVTGEIMRIGLVCSGDYSMMELRSLADWDIRQRLLTVPGVAQVTVIGGELKEYQIIVDPIRLSEYRVSLSQIQSALQHTNINLPGGFVFEEGRELLVRNIGRPAQIQDLEQVVIERGAHGSVRLGDVAKIVTGAAQARGSAGISGQDGVMLTIFKQPGVNTLELTRRLEQALIELDMVLPPQVQLIPQVYRQSVFIKTAIKNVSEALRDGAVLVVIIILLFLLNLRMSLIILVTIPLSFLVTVIVFSIMGMTVNTMTLGGLAVAVGELVDAAIVSAENIYRRLRQRNDLPLQQQQPYFTVIAHATHEVCGAIVAGTLIVLVVVTPLFALPGMVGRLFSPIGTAYLISILSSVGVAIIITPVLCAFLLHYQLPPLTQDTWLVRKLKQAIAPLVLKSIQYPWMVLVITGGLSLWALGQALNLGRDLLPEFNEGSVMVLAMTPPGTNLEESSNIGKTIEQAMHRVPEISASVTGRETGRAEGDEHASGVNVSHVVAEFRNPFPHKPRSRNEVLRDLRDALHTVPGVVTEVEQPIQHRISVIVGGARTQVIIKIFGPELTELRRLGEQVNQIIADIPGVVDHYVEQQGLIPQVLVEPDHHRLVQYGLQSGEVLETVETALQGQILSKTLEGERSFNFVLRYPDAYRNDIKLIETIPIATKQGSTIPLHTVAKVSPALGPNIINHENARRRIFVLCNVSGRDLASTVQEISSRVATQLTIPDGYSIQMGGQYEQLKDAQQQMLILSLLALAIVLSLLLVEFRSLPLSLIVMSNIPQAMIGAVIALLITDTHLNMGVLVGFIALCGIASRNAILLLSHFVTLVRQEQVPLSPELLLRGCQERLPPVLMTTLTTNLGLIPLVLSQGESGKEILYPIALVIFGGMCSSTLLDYTITPACAWLFGRRGILRLAQQSSVHEDRDVHKGPYPLQGQ